MGTDSFQTVLEQPHRNSNGIREKETLVSMCNHSTWQFQAENGVVEHWQIRCFPGLLLSIVTSSSLNWRFHHTVVQLMKQYNPSKPEKFGLLWRALCDTIVQCTNFSLAYAGKLHITGTIRKHEILTMDYGLIGMTLMLLYEFIIISIHSLIYSFVHQSTHSFNHSFIQWTISMRIHHTVHPINLSIDPFFHMFFVYALIFHYLFRPIPIDWYFIYSFFFSPKFR